MFLGSPEFITTFEVMHGSSGKQRNPKPPR